MKLTGHIRCFSVVILTILIAETTTRAMAAQRPPNIVFVMADDLGYGHLGSYGQTKIRTPHLDKMAAEGTQFMQFYAGAAVCAPSRSVLMTGMHCGHTPVRANSGGVPLRPSDVTVAEKLHDTGYTTGIFGKWGLGNPGSTGIPTRQGFDEFFGYLHQVHAHFYYPAYLWQNEKKYELPENFGQQEKQYTHDEIMSKAFDFVRAEASSGSPFFLYVPLTIPHSELLVPEDSFDEYEGQFVEDNPYVDERGHYADQPAPHATYAAMVTRMDRDMGRLFKLLSGLGIDDDTIVFFTSDNGPALRYVEFFDGNGPLRGGKGELYEGGIRVPLVVRWPGHVEANRVDVDHVWYFADLMPTLAELAGIENPQALDGISFVPAILGESAVGRPQPEHEFMYWQHTTGGKTAQAARMGNWKAYRGRGKTTTQLFNLESDLGEEMDVAGSYPEVAMKLSNYLNAAQTPERDYPREPSTSGLPRLETGYFDMGGPRIGK